MAECENRKTMRLFVALEPSDGFRDALAGLQERLRAAGVTGRWLRPANLHLTLAFIGMWTPDAAELLPPVEQPFSITLSHPGVFPAAGVLWAGVRPSRALDGLAERVRAALGEAGVPFDPKSFTPHITLARKPRVPEGLELPEFRVPPARMIVREVCLYQSRRTEDGMAYTVIGRGRKPEEGP